MTSKHAQWQSRWDVDTEPGVALHDTGLRVRLKDGQGVAENPEHTALSLAAVHGAHNAAAMVQRLVREGAQMLVDPYARGWRGQERPT